MRALLALGFAFVFLACGAKTGLRSDQDASAALAVLAERCNALDDDGDGLIDESIPDIHCGLGLCERVLPGCDNGFVPECTPIGSDRPEVCSGQDEDCDGKIDEGFPIGPIGEAVIVRDIDDYGSDRCETCRLAFAPDLVATEAGMVATWRLSFLGTDPEPNTFSRFIEPDGDLGGEIELLFERNTTQGPVSTRTSDGAALVFCGRHGADDVADSVLLDGFGRPIAGSDAARSPTGRSCGASPPAVAAAPDSRLMYAWTDNSSAPLQGFEVLVDAAGANNQSTGWAMPHLQAFSSPSLAHGHEGFMMAVTIREDESDAASDSVLMLHRYDEDGNELHEAVAIPSEGMTRGWDPPGIFATDTGWIVLGKPRTGSGRYVLQLDRQGYPIEEVELVDVDSTFVNAFAYDVWSQGYFLTTTRDIGEGYEYVIVVLDEDGQTTQVFDRYDAWYYAFAESGGKLFALHTQAIDSEHNQLRLERWGCQPEKP